MLSAQSEIASTHVLSETARGILEVLPPFGEVILITAGPGTGKTTTLEQLGAMGELTIDLDKCGGWKNINVPPNSPYRDAEYPGEPDAAWMKDHRYVLDPTKLEQRLGALRTFFPNKPIYTAGIWFGMFPLLNIFTKSVLLELHNPEEQNSRCKNRDATRNPHNRTDAELDAMHTWLEPFQKEAKDLGCTPIQATLSPLAIAGRIRGMVGQR